MNATTLSTQSTLSYQQTSFSYQQNQSGTLFQLTQLTITAQQTDTVQFGVTPPTHGQSLNIILQSAYDKLTQLVGDAKDALDISQNSPLDTSPEATANRIADFALNFFERFAAQHEELHGQDAKQAFVDLISPAIQKGIAQAAEILTALSALTPDTQNNIGTIQDIIQQRLDQFLSQSK